MSKTGVKVLKMKSKDAFILYNKLRKVPPSEFQNTEEMMTLVDDIIPVLKDDLGEYLKFSAQAEEVQWQFALKKVSEKDANNQLKEINEAANLFEIEHKKDELSLEFTKPAFNSLFQFFEKWGKSWFLSVEDYVEVRNCFNDANSTGGRKSDKEE